MSRQHDTCDKNMRNKRYYLFLFWNLESNIPRTLTGEDRPLLRNQGFAAAAAAVAGAGSAAAAAANADSAAATAAEASFLCS